MVRQPEKYAVLIRQLSMKTELKKKIAILKYLEVFIVSAY